MNVFISGGTTGLGFGLAVYYLKKGYSVGICGRDKNKVNKEIKNRYPLLSVYELNVVDKNQLSKAVYSFIKKTSNKLDLMIACAGSYANSRTTPLNEEQAVNMLQVNIVGTINAFEIAREIMLKHKSGQIAGISSVAGLFKYPGASLYSASKKVVIDLCNAYHTALNKFGIHVTAIVPGYIDTQKLRDLNKNNTKSKPFLISVDEAVLKITTAISQKKRQAVFPLRMKLVIKFLSLLPQWFLSLIFVKVKKK